MHRLPRFRERFEWPAVAPLPFAVAITAALIIWSLGAPASAQIIFDPNCPPTAWCHPDGEGLSFSQETTDAVDAIGKDLIRRRESGDCTGLGPEGCLGVIMAQLMCAIDGREIAQIACGEGAGGGGDGGSGGSGGSGAGGETPGEGGGGQAPDAPKDTADVTTQNLNATSFASNPRFNPWVRDRLSKLRPNEPLVSLRGEGGVVRITRVSQYEVDPDNPREYFAILKAEHVRSKHTTYALLAGNGDLVFAQDATRYLRRRGRR